MNQTTEFKKGDRKKFLDYEIIYCTNNDGIVLLKREVNNYEMHLGNYDTLDAAQQAAIVYYMIARPNIFATSLCNKIMASNSKSGTMSEWYAFKNSVIKDGLEMPEEVTAIDGTNFMIGYKNNPLKY